MDPKLKDALRSRKMWAAMVIVATATTLWRLGEISGDQLASAMVLSMSVYMGSVAVEDGLRSAVRSWFATRAPVMQQVPGPTVVIHAEQVVLRV